MRCSTHEIYQMEEVRVTYTIPGSISQVRCRLRGKQDGNCMHKWGTFLARHSFLRQAMAPRISMRTAEGVWSSMPNSFFARIIPKSNEYSRGVWQMWMKVLTLLLAAMWSIIGEPKLVKITDYEL